MLEDTNTGEQTLPSVKASAGHGYRRERLLLTIAWHPDPARIGEVAALSSPGVAGALLLGRQQPRFSSRRERGPARPLADRHISRLAIEMHWRGHHLLLQRDSSANRCRVNGAELQSQLTLEQAQLRRGVILLLAHNVVLLLRLGELAPPLEPPAATAAIIGSSDYSGRLRRQIVATATSDIDVLIRGETGTGKELVAAAIHAAGNRAGKAWIAVNMSAIPAALAPAALFGSVRGAFSGADRATAGYFQQAEGGTLFLDEVGDTAPEVQPQLLRALQEREIQVVGGSIRKVNVRVVSATDAPLDGDDSEFRAALRHRLGAAEIRLLPLREHREDIGELWWYFLRREFGRRGRDALLPTADSAPLAMARWADLLHNCLLYSWPGNVRELANRARQLATHCTDELSIPAEFHEALAGAEDQATRSSGDRGTDDRQRRMQCVPEAEFLRAWQAEDFEVAAIARALGVSRQAVYRRIAATAGMRTATAVSDEELRAALQVAGDDVRQVARSLRVSYSALAGRVRQLRVSG